MSSTYIEAVRAVALTRKICLLDDQMPWIMSDPQTRANVFLSALMQEPKRQMVSGFKSKAKGRATCVKN